MKLIKVFIRVSYKRIKAEMFYLKTLTIVETMEYRRWIHEVYVAFGEIILTAVGTSTRRNFLFSVNLPTTNTRWAVPDVRGHKMTS